jgi:predicted RNA-binding protein with RPS1 domain
LLPGVETGLGREVNLGRRFKTGDRVQVEIIEVDDRGRIRLSQRSIREREEKQAGAKATRGSGETLPTAPPGGFNVLAEAFKRAEDRQKEKDA